MSRNRFTSGSSIELLHTDGAFTPALDAYAGAGKVAALRRAFAYFGYNLEKSGAVRELVIDNLHGVELIGGAPLASGGCHTTPRGRWRLGGWMTINQIGTSAPVASTPCGGGRLL